jgi:hypothetical protein
MVLGLVGYHQSQYSMPLKTTQRWERPCRINTVPIFPNAFETIVELVLNRSHSSMTHFLSCDPQSPPNVTHAASVTWNVDVTSLISTAWKRLHFRIGLGPVIICPLPLLPFHIPWRGTVDQRVGSGKWPHHKSIMGRNVSLMRRNVCGVSGPHRALLYAGRPNCWR